VFRRETFSSSLFSFRSSLLSDRGAIIERILFLFSPSEIARSPLFFPPFCTRVRIQRAFTSPLLNPKHGWSSPFLEVRWDFQSPLFLDRTEISGSPFLSPFFFSFSERFAFDDAPAEVPLTNNNQHVSVFSPPLRGEAFSSLFPSQSLKEKI